jgi:hypothetical protein
MDSWAPRKVDQEEAKRLGVPAGWYGTKVSGTFVTGPLETHDACLAAISALTGIPIKVVRN